MLTFDDADWFALARSEYNKSRNVGDPSWENLSPATRRTVERALRNAGRAVPEGTGGAHFFIEADGTAWQMRPLAGAESIWAGPVVVGRAEVEGAKLEEGAAPKAPVSHPAGPVGSGDE